MLWNYVYTWFSVIINMSITLACHVNFCNTITRSLSPLLVRRFKLEFHICYLLTGASRWESHYWKMEARHTPRGWWRKPAGGEWTSPEDLGLLLVSGTQSWSALMHASSKDWRTQGHICGRRWKLMLLHTNPKHIVHMLQVPHRQTQPHTHIHRNNAHRHSVLQQNICTHMTDACHTE